MLATLNQKISLRQIFSSQKSFFSEILKSNSKYPIAIIGSGPSGFYTCKYLLDQHQDIHIDIYERLPFPYGLVRYGVAPDHPEVKTVTNSFEEIFQSAKNQNRIRYFGNIEIGRDPSKHLSLESLLSSYSAVILAYGAHSDHDLRLLHENEYSGILSSREFVNWYNGHPDYQHLHQSKHLIDGDGKLRKIRNIVIIGNGNVAIDCARICMKDVQELAKTDITTESLEWIEEIQKDLETVYIIGRRGHVQSSFTIKELRELTRLTNQQGPIPVIINPSELTAGMTASSAKELENYRPKKRIIELIDTIAKQPHSDAKKKIELRFLLSPTKLIPNPVDNHIKSIIFQKNHLIGEPNQQQAYPMEHDTTELPCDLLIKSIGYKSISIDPLIPFNTKTNTVTNEHGKVLFVNNSSFGNKLFVTGWLKRGPNGIIGTNIIDAKETTAQVIEAVISRKLQSFHSEYDPAKILQNESAQFQSLYEQSISWKQVQALNQIELEQGEKHQPKKLREKLTTVQKMLQFAKP